MEIIHDAYNKNMKCPNCESTFRYNEKDIEDAFPCHEMVERHMEGLKKAKGFSYVTYKTAQALHCPLCNTIILLNQVGFYGRE
ncbi:MAG: hypothetical protein KBT27_16390 [Prevotellaceae bacterium]|nr:hypothetical protein [Candidatus Faecinaster equi]